MAAQYNVQRRFPYCCDRDIALQPTGNREVICPVCGSRFGLDGILSMLEPYMRYHKFEDTNGFRILESK